jgi:hypothetical protein
MAKKKPDEDSGYVLSIDKAADEIVAWLDLKKISFAKRAAAAANIARLINAVAEGVLVVDPATKKITQKLKFPVGKDEAVKELEFKPRLAVGDVQSRLSSAGNDAVARVLAYVGAATGEDAAVLGKMDSEDYHLSGDLVVFFMIPG